MDTGSSPKWQIPTIYVLGVSAASVGARCRLIDVVSKESVLVRLMGGRHAGERDGETDSQEGITEGFRLTQSEMAVPEDARAKGSATPPPRPHITEGMVTIRANLLNVFEIERP